MASPTYNSQQEQAANFIDHFESMRNEYRMLQTGPNKKQRRGIPSMGEDADLGLASESLFFRMIELSRDIFKNDPIIGQGIRRLVSNVIGNGFTPDPDTGDIGVDLAQKERWNEFAANPDVRGEQTFCDIERTLLQSVYRDGDIAPVTVEDTDGVGRLQVFEAHQVRNPNNTNNKNIVFGVELDSRRRKVAYYIDPTVSGVRGRYRNPTHRIDARTPDGIPIVMHLAFPDRISQTRGIPIIQAVSDFVAYHDDIQFSQLVKQQVASCFVLLKSKATGAPVFGGGSPNAVSEQYSDGIYRKTEELYPGKQITGAPGETIQGFSPNVPNQEYFQHVSLILQIIAVNLNLPVQVLLLDPSQTNFSGWRGAIDQAKQRWQEIQSSFTSMFHSKVWAWKVNEWANTERYFSSARNRLKNYTNCIWHPPSWPYIEPMKDAQADAFVISNRLNSSRRVYGKRGQEYDVILPEIISDNGDAVILAKQKAMEINKQFNDDSPVDWREILSVPVAGNFTQSFSRTETEKSAIEDSQ